MLTKTLLSLSILLLFVTSLVSAYTFQDTWRNAFFNDTAETGANMNVYGWTNGTAYRINYNTSSTRVNGSKSIYIGKLQTGSIFINLSSANYTVPENFNISMNINFSGAMATTGASFLIIIGQWNGNNMQFGVRIASPIPGTNWTYYTPGVGSWKDAGKAINFNQWEYFRLAMNSTHFRWFINEQNIVNGTNGNIAWATQKQFTLSPNNNTLPVTIDDIHIWNGTLTPCLYPGSGNWVLENSYSCNISTSMAMTAGSTLTVNGTGTTRFIGASITGCSLLKITNGGLLYGQSGGKLPCSR